MKEQTYGYFPGGDPRLFTPDVDVCTPEEIEAHRSACSAADAGDSKEHPPGHGLLQRGDGGFALWHGGPFGVGVYEIDVDEDE